MKKLYSFNWECGRMGDLYGLFVADEKDVAEVVGKTIYFGEVLGKHSDVYGEVEECDFTVVTDDQTVINILVDAMSGTSLSGYNPLEYYRDALSDGVYDEEEEG